MKNLFYRASHGSRVLAILVFASVFILGEYFAVAPKPALAAGARVSICHRTKSTTNPYRLITVSNSAVAGGGHARHTGAVWTASNTNGQTWGDIIPGDDTDGDQFWSDGSGVASSAYNWDATGKSFMVPLGANLSKCTRMTAKQFYDIGIAAGQMFAAGLGVPCYSVVSLDALAFASFETDPQTASVSQQQPLLVTSDARRGEVYWALYQTRDQHRVPIRTGEPAVLKPELLEQLLNARQLNPVRNTAKISAGWVALLAQAQLEAGVLSKDISPLYLRPADATMPKGAVGKRVSG